MAIPFTNKVEKGWKKCLDPMVGGARSTTLYDACTPSSVCSEVLIPSEVVGVSKVANN